MNEAERYLNEKQRGTPPKDVQPVANNPPAQSHYSADRTPPPVSQVKQGNSVGKYVFAVCVCVGIFLLYTFIAHSMHWQRGGGYIAMAIVFTMMIGVWKAITSK
jgi:hypothetical protein